MNWMSSQLASSDALESSNRQRPWLSAEYFHYRIQRSKSTSWSQLTKMCDLFLLTLYTWISTFSICCSVAHFVSIPCLKCRNEKSRYVEISVSQHCGRNDLLFPACSILFSVWSSVCTVKVGLGFPGIGAWSGGCRSDHPLHSEVLSDQDVSTPWLTTAMGS